jgi:hypothetical protein
MVFFNISFHEEIFRSRILILLVRRTVKIEK